MHMTIPAEVRTTFYVLRAVALAVGLSGIAAIVLGGDSYGLRSLGLVGIVVGLWLVRRSNSYVWAARGQAVGKWSPTRAAMRVEPLAWIFTASSLAACVVFYLAARVDASHGGKEVWPAYALFAAVLALAVSSGYVAMKLFR